MEIGLVGFEGVTGSFFICWGSSPSVFPVPDPDCRLCVTGSRFAIWIKLFNDSHGIRSAILQYVQHQMAHLGQTAACKPDARCGGPEVLRAGC